MVNLYFIYLTTHIYLGLQVGFRVVWDAISHHSKSGVPNLYTLIRNFDSLCTVTNFNMVYDPLELVSEI